MKSSTLGFERIWSPTLAARPQIQKTIPTGNIMDQEPNMQAGIASLFSNYGRNAGPLQPNADERTLEKGTEDNGTPDAACANLAEEKNSLDEINRQLLSDKANLETQAMALQETLTKLRHKLEESEKVRDAQMEELKSCQTQEYEKTRGTARESHEAISSQFREIFRQCTDWARDYFNIKMVDFDISKFPEFKRELEEVSWDNSDWSSKELFKASHLVQAVLGNIVCNQIFYSPFSGTPPGFYQQFQNMYEVKCEIDTAEAQRWRASSLQTFHSCTRWPLSGPKSYDHKLYKERHTMYIFRRIEEVLRPITTAHYPMLSTQELCVQKQRLCAIIKYAKELGEKMSKQSSKLQILSKSWYSNNDRLFIPNDPRVKSRLGDEDYDPQDLLRVDLILSPGFLKYGNDNGENLDEWSVWTPAIVDTHNPAKPFPSPPSIPSAVSVRTPPACSSGDCEELPGEMQKEVGSLSTAAK